MLPHSLHQPAGDLLAVFIRMGVINLIADGPEQKAGMIPVPAHPASHILFTPFLKKSAVVKLCLRKLPHIESLA